MTKQINNYRINNYLVLDVEIRESEKLLGVNAGYAYLIDCNTGEIIRTIRGMIIQSDVTAEKFCDKVIRKLSTLITRYSILAKAYEIAVASGDYFTQLDIEKWINEDPQFNDCRWHGDKK